MSVCRRREGAPAARIAARLRSPAPSPEMGRFRP